MLNIEDKHWNLFQHWEGLEVGCGFHFKDMTSKSGIPREELRPLVHDLRDAGYLQFMKGCTTDEGEFYGSAYVLTEAGATALSESRKARQES